MSSVNGYLPLAKDIWGRRTKAAIYASDPVLWMQEVGGFYPWAKQREFFYSVRDNRATAVAAAHSVGKSFGTAWLIAWWVDVHPLDEVFVATTAPTQDQLAIIWDTLRSIYAKIEQRYKDGLIDHKLPGRITGDNRWKLDNGQTIAEGRKPPDSRSDVAFQGRHSGYLLAIADEATGVPAGFIDALGNIATGRNNRQLLIANPTDPTSAMAKIWKDKNPEWHRMHISVFDSPTMTPEEGFDAEYLESQGMAGSDYIRQKLEEYGSEDDPRYIARVLGQWAFDGGNNVFAAEEIARGCETVVRPYPDALPEFGVDIARMGPDASVIYTITKGEVWSVWTDEDDVVHEEPTGREGWQMRRLAKWKKAPVSGSNPENLGSAQRIHQYALAEGARIVKLDASGIGGGVIDGLSEIARTTILPYLWFEIFAGSTKDVDTRAYTNARAEQYFRFKKLLADGVLDIEYSDEELREELQGLVYEYDSKGRIKIESKDDMKRRGVKSPDHADAAWYALMDVSAVMSPPQKHVVLHRGNDDPDLASNTRSFGGYKRVNWG